MYRPTYDFCHNRFQWRASTGLCMPFQRRNQLQHYRPPVIQETGEHWCETCDKRFPALHVLENHKAQHQKCKIDGCQFVAHPKVITRHIQMQHSTGLYNKISKLDDPEEIRKWREERKKNYPTKANIEKKAAEIKEKIERGERMGLKHDQNQRNKKTGGAEKRRQPFTQHSPPFFKKKKIPPKKVIHVNERKTLKPFAGIQSLMMDDNEDVKAEQTQCDFVIEDDDYDQTQFEKSPKTNEPTVCGALSSLICNYESSEEGRDTEEKISNMSSKESEKSLDNCNSLHTIDKEEVGNKDFKNNNKSDSESGPEEAAIMKKSNDNTDEPNKVNYKDKKNMKKKEGDNKGKKTIVKKCKPKLPSTLLEKLLSREIKQERNMILQCVRYIVKNNCFDK